jgi:hypothetical protein
MAARLAFSRIAPGFLHARVTPSLAVLRAARVRSYASSSENSVSPLQAGWEKIQLSYLRVLDDSS